MISVIIFVSRTQLRCIMIEVLCQNDPYRYVKMPDLLDNGHPDYRIQKWNNHNGYKDNDNKKSWYISGGPVATDTPFTDELEYTFGGFLGGAYRINDKTAVYGEIFGDTNETVIGKTGFTYTF